MLAGPPRAPVQTARRLMYLNFVCSDFSDLLYLALGVGLLSGSASSLLHLYSTEAASGSPFAQRFSTVPSGRRTVPASGWT